MSCESLWLGALSDVGVTAVARLANGHTAARLVVTGPGGIVYSDPAATVGNIVKLPISGLTPATEYTCQVEGPHGVAGVSGRFRTAPSGAGSFLVAFSGDASEGSNHVVFDAIRAKDPLLFLHMGDLHYRNPDVNSAPHYRAVLDEVLLNPRQARLFREYPTAYVWDDHDFATNNSDSSAVGKAAAAAMYRARVPHYTLPDATGIWQSFDIGRVRFILTDQRSAASANNVTDNASKSMLGATQKAWLLDLLSNSAGKLIVWVCPRSFGGVATVGADHWGGFTNERTAIGTHIHANCPGRVVVLSADQHALGIDDGSHHTYGGEALRTFQAAPLDRSVDATPYGSAQYSHGWFNEVGQFGTMAVNDNGGPIGITWRGYNSAGTELTSLAFSVAV